MSAPIEQRAFVELPIGVTGKDGEVVRDAEVRAVTGGDEFYIGMSAEYTRNPNDLVYKTLLLSRCVKRIGENTVVTIEDIKKLHVQDVRALEYAIYALSYGAAAIPKGDPSQPGVSVTYPLNKIREEAAFIAYHLHWSLDDILALPHRERVAWVGQVSAINKRVLESEG